MYNGARNVLMPYYKLEVLDAYIAGNNMHVYRASMLVFFFLDMEIGGTHRILKLPIVEFVHCQ